MCGDILAFMIGGMIGDKIVNVFGGRGRRGGFCMPPILTSCCSYRPLPFCGEDTGIYLSPPPRLGIYDRLLDPNLAVWRYTTNLLMQRSSHMSKSGLPGLDQLSLTNPSQQAQQQQQQQVQQQQQQQQQQQEETLTDEQKVEERKMTAQYNDLAKLLNLHKNRLSSSTNAKDRETVAKIDVALEKKDGTIKEKYESLKNVYKELDKIALKQTIMQMEPKKVKQANNNGTEEYVNDPADDTPDLRAMLMKSGYHFGLNDNSIVTSDDKFDLDMSELDEAYEAISRIGDSNIHATAFQNVTNKLGTENDNNILRVLSLWNDKHNSDSNRCILRHIKAQMTCCSETAKKDIINLHVKPLVLALVKKANHIKTYSDVFTSQELQNLNSLSGELTELNSKVDYSNMNKLIDKFEMLYVTLREMDAKRINAEIVDRYSFLNDIADDDIDIIDSSLVVDDTNEDIKAEKCSKIVKKREEEERRQELVESVPTVIQNLIRDGIFQETAVEGVYKMNRIDPNNDTNKPPHYIVHDGKIYLLKNVEMVLPRQTNDEWKYSVTIYNPTTGKSKAYIARAFTGLQDIKLVEETETEIRHRMNAAMHENGVRLGKTIAENTVGIISTKSQKEINTEILTNQINKDNITDVIYGYRKYYNSSTSTIYPLAVGSGIFASLNQDDIKLKYTRILVDKLLEAAREVGLTEENDSDIRLLKKNLINEIKTSQTPENEEREYDENSTISNLTDLSTYFDNKPVTLIFDDYIYNITKKIRKKLGLPIDGLP